MHDRRNRVYVCRAEIFVACRKQLEMDVQAEVEFLDEIQTKVLRVFLLVIYSQLYSFA
jgi:hypothetical protein